MSEQEAAHQAHLIPKAMRPPEQLASLDVSMTAMIRSETL